MTQHLPPPVPLPPTGPELTKAELINYKQRHHGIAAGYSVFRWRCDAGRQPSVTLVRETLTDPALAAAAVAREAIARAM